MTCAARMRSQVSSRPTDDEGNDLRDSEHEPTATVADDTVYTSAQSFEDLGLHEDLLKVRL